MICDVCNKVIDNESDSARLPPNIFALLMDDGFGIVESNIEMLAGSGMDRNQAILTIKQQYAQSTSEWLLCRECSTEAITRIEKLRKNL